MSFKNTPVVINAEITYTTPDFKTLIRILNETYPWLYGLMSMHKIINKNKRGYQDSTIERMMYQLVENPIRGRLYIQDDFDVHRSPFSLKECMPNHIRATYDRGYKINIQTLNDGVYQMTVSIKSIKGRDIKLIAESLLKKDSHFKFNEGRNTIKGTLTSRPDLDQIYEPSCTHTVVSASKGMSEVDAFLQCSLESYCLQLSTNEPIEKIKEVFTVYDDLRDQFR